METEISPGHETPIGESVWKPEDFRRYLLALSHSGPSKDFCLELAKFPKHILLDSPWHENFERMRKETAKDDHERWALIGVNRNRDRVFVSQNFVRAKEPRSAIEAEGMISKVIDANKQDIIFPVGDIHSHPQFHLKLLGKLLEMDYFSPGDFYALLYSSQFQRQFWLLFLVGPTENKVVFRTQETRSLPPFTDQELFSDVWNEKGITGRGNNIATVKRYQLAIYNGKPGKKLTRMFP